ncbi:hypothetical protein Dcar01_02260 [Deinococcus carri]|uniref:Uncharacterized protein n=2 Tax=Deinococcus carri TaxID=1211323 RepID=A0ABP9W8Q9_9DEIO
MLFKKESYFSIIDIVEGARYSYRTNEHHYALYKKHTIPPGMDLHKHFFKVYDFITDTILVHVHDEPEVGPIVVENPVFIPYEKPELGDKAQK